MITIKESKNNIKTVLFKFAESGLYYRVVKGVGLLSTGDLIYKPYCQAGQHRYDRVGRYGYDYTTNDSGQAYLEAELQELDVELVIKN